MPKIGLLELTWKANLKSKTDIDESDKTVHQYLINEHRLISNWISGPYLLEIVDSEMRLSLKYSGGNNDYADHSGFIKDFTNFYSNALFVLDNKEIKLSIHVLFFLNYLF